MPQKSSPKTNFAILLLLSVSLGTVCSVTHAQEALVGPTKIAGTLTAKDIQILTLKNAKRLKASVKTSVFEKSIDALATGVPITNGVNWLDQNQNPDGSWSKGSRTESRDTERVLEAFNLLNKQKDDIFSDGIDWFSLYYSENNDYLARQTNILSLLQENLSDFDDFLAQQINPDGGFGYKSGYGSDILTSALVLRALTASGYQDSGPNPQLTIINILNYLFTSMTSDGAWGFRRGDPSTLYPTLIALEAIVPYKDLTLGGFPGGDLVIKTKTDLAINWVLSNQQADGGFGDEGSSNIAWSALAYHILLQYDDFPTNNEAAIGYLVNTQETDGSWNAQDPYATAVSLMALGRPDIAVTSIEKTSELLPNQTAQARILVGNIGYVSSQPMPSSQLVLIVDGREIPLEGLPQTITFGENSTLDLNLILENLPAGQHTIGFRVDYENTELRENNNSLEETFTWTDPTFVGPPPPAWAGSITSSSAGSIIITWLPSTGNDLDHYDIYFGVEPNNYIGSLSVGIGVGVQLSGFTLDVPYYFSVVAVNSSGDRGDYSIETSAIARSSPDDYRGQISGNLTSNGQPLSDVTITVYQTVSGVVNGSYIANLYPGDYYITASKSGYESVSQMVNLPDNGNITGVDFDLPIVNDGVPPPAITGLNTTPDDGQVSLSWNASGAADFSQYNIYRQTLPFTDITNLTPLVSLSNVVTVDYTDPNAVNGVSYHYVVTAVDLAGNELLTVSSIGPAKPNSAPGISNVVAQQQADGRVQITYNLADAENTQLSTTIEYWDGTNWQSVLTLNQSLGSKAVMWDAKSDVDGTDQNGAKMRITSSDGESVNSTASDESNTFQLDTQDPPIPVVNSITSPTNIRNQTLQGTKEDGAALLINGEEIEPLGTSADWNHEVALSEGENHFRFVAKDAFGNLSGMRLITIVLDTLPPNGNSSVVQLDQTSPTEVTSSWDAVIQDSAGNPETVEKYVIYRGETANFDPTPENLLAEVTDTIYTDSPETLGDVDVNSYYAIEVVDAVGHRSWLANRVGEYEFRLYTTTGNNYTLISLPFNIEGIEMASDFASYIETHTDRETTVFSVSYWNPIAQSYRTYNPLPAPFGDFALSAGGAYQLEVRINGVEDVNDSTIVTFVGQIPGPQTFDLKTTTGTDYTWVSLLLGHTDILMASQLQQNIETHSNPPTTVKTISYWNPIAQSYRTYDPFPAPFGDFEVKDGRAYQVEVTQDSTWSP